MTVPIYLPNGSVQGHHILAQTFFFCLLDILTGVCVGGGTCSFD